MIANDKENVRIIEILDSVAGVGPVMIKNNELWQNERSVSAKG